MGDRGQGRSHRVQVEAAFAERADDARSDPSQKPRPRAATSAAGSLPA
jgi:hypothetical protein